MEIEVLSHRSIRMTGWNLYDWMRIIIYTLHFEIAMQIITQTP